MINILCANIDIFFANNDFAKYSDFLSFDQQKRLNRFYSDDDRKRFLLGNILIEKQLDYFGLSSKFGLYCLKKTVLNRPYFDIEGFDFNVSHSGKNVVCCASFDSMRVGIDIEEIREIELSLFKLYLTDNEFRLIENSADLQEFFRIWTRKEAVIKSKSGGNLDLLPEFDVCSEFSVLRGEQFFLKSIEIIDNYALSIASNKKEQNLNIIIID